MTRVLIAEDEPRIAAFMQKGLERAGFETDIANDGDTALSAMRSEPFDLLLLDLGLPGKDGQAVLKEMRSQGHTLPVVIVTARDPQDVEIARELADDFVRKPFRMRNLLQTIDQLLPLDENQDEKLSGGSISGSIIGSRSLADL